MRIPRAGATVGAKWTTAHEQERLTLNAWKRKGRFRLGYPGGSVSRTPIARPTRRTTRSTAASTCTSSAMVNRSSTSATATSSRSWMKTVRPSHRRARARQRADGKSRARQQRPPLPLVQHAHPDAPLAEDPSRARRARRARRTTTTEPGRPARHRRHASQVGRASQTPAAGSRRGSSCPSHLAAPQLNSSPEGEMGASVPSPRPSRPLEVLWAPSASSCLPTLPKP